MLNELTPHVNTTSHPWGSMGLLFANSEQSGTFSWILKFAES